MVMSEPTVAEAEAAWMAAHDEVMEAQQVLDDKNIALNLAENDMFAARQRE